MKLILNKINIKAIMVGAIVDKILTSIFGGIFVFLVVLKNLSHNSNITSDQVKQLVMALPLSTYIISLLIGIIASIIGGYIAARISKINIYLNSGVASFVCVISGVYSLLNSSGHHYFSKPISLLLIPANILFYLFGGFLYKKLKFVKE